MPLATVEDFRGGVDRRRNRAAALPGTLWIGSNCHITEGGEIEKRNKFTPKYQLYPGHTFGMKGAGGTPFVFGYEDSATFPAGAIPAGVTYQRLVHPTVAATPILAILDAIAFLGKVYVIVKFTDNSIHHYWDGVRVADWDGGAGNPSAKGTFGVAVGSKIYIAAGAVVYHCDLNNPAEWTIGAGTSGAGFFNVTSSGKGSEILVAMIPYQTSQIAFFASSYVQTWAVFSDQSKNAAQQTVDNTGGIAAHGVVSSGNVDSFYLSSSAIRSLRQQNVTGAPFAMDVGDSIRNLVKVDIATLSASVLAATQAAVNPVDGRLWFWIGTRIYVFSDFSSSKIKAWSWYDFGKNPGVLDVIGTRMYLRSEDTIYVYGGDTGADYDTGPGDAYFADVEMPFMNSNSIAEDKIAMSYDVGAEGEWDCFMKSDPNNTDVEDGIGTVDFYTYPEPKMPMAITSTHFSPRFRSTKPGPAKICNFAFSFERADI